MSIFYFSWGRKGSNSFYIPLVRPSSLGGNEVTQKLDRIPSKLTFVDSYSELCLSVGL